MGLKWNHTWVGKLPTSVFLAMDMYELLPDCFKVRPTSWPNVKPILRMGVEPLPLSRAMQRAIVVLASLAQPQKPSDLRSHLRSRLLAQTQATTTMVAPTAAAIVAETDDSGHLTQLCSSDLKYQPCRVHTSQSGPVWFARQ